VASHFRRKLRWRKTCPDMDLIIAGPPSDVKRGGNFAWAIFPKRFNEANLRLKHPDWPSNTADDNRRQTDKQRSPCAAEGEEKRDNTQGLEGSTIHINYTQCLHRGKGFFR